MGLARRSFLRGHFKPSPDVIRPPFAIVEREFLALCEQCSDCVSSCGEKVIIKDDKGFPRMSFELGECTFCADCLEACKTGAFDRDKARPWAVIAQIGGNCLAVNGVVCRTCGDVCDEEAISFRLMTKGRSLPVLKEKDCTGCGACVFTCPNKSIEMADRQKEIKGLKVQGREELSL